MGNDGEGGKGQRGGNKMRVEGEKSQARGGYSVEE